MLQRDMFTGELIDNRTRRQKARARKSAKPFTAEMFPSREVAQFGIRAHPLLPISPTTKLTLTIQDPRSPEEREAALWREAERKTRRFRCPST